MPQAFPPARHQQGRGVAWPERRRLTRPPHAGKEGSPVTDQPSADLISLPQGGGAISGIGETFQPDLHTGTGNLTLPLELPAGRNGLQPSLSLSYSTGNPNGPFGLGWSFPVPGVRRKTDNGIPRYHPDLDTFVLSGAEDLVPVPGTGTDAVRYRPR